MPLLFSQFLHCSYKNFIRYSKLNWRVPHVNNISSLGRLGGDAASNEVLRRKEKHAQRISGIVGVRTVNMKDCGNIPLSEKMTRNSGDPGIWVVKCVRDRIRLGSV